MLSFRPAGFIFHCVDRTRKICPKETQTTAKPQLLQWQKQFQFSAFNRTQNLSSRNFVAQKNDNKVSYWKFR